jgi:hypothetical protein
VNERILRAEKVKDGMIGGNAWLTLTTERLVFTAKEDIGQGEKWSTPLELVESVRAKKAFRAGTEVLEVFFRNAQGKRDHKSFERMSWAAWANAMGGTSRSEPNSFAMFETQIVAAREAKVAAASAWPPPPPPAVANSAAADGISALERLVALHRAGALTDEEFAAAKARLLGL